MKRKNGCCDGYDRGHGHDHDYDCDHEWTCDDHDVDCYCVLYFCHHLFGLMNAVLTQDCHQMKSFQAGAGAGAEAEDEDEDEAEAEAGFEVVVCFEALEAEE